MDRAPASTNRNLSLFSRSWASPHPGAEPAVLLHGAVIAQRYMWPLAESLSDFMPVHCLDLPGYGGSAALRAPTTVEQHADVVAGWLAERGLGPVTLVGNSLGSQIALSVAERHPSRVGALVLIGLTMDPGGRSAWQLIARSSGILITEPLPLHLWWAADSLKAGPVATIKASLAALRHHPERQINLVAAPVLVLRGSRDALVSGAWNERAAAAAGVGMAITVAEAGHAAHFSRPLAVTDAILSFLRSYRPGALGATSGSDRRPSRWPEPAAPSVMLDAWLPR